MPRLTLEQRVEIKTHLDLGIEVSVIAKKYKIHRSSVHRLRQKITQTGSVKDKKKSGRPREVTDRIVRNVVNCSIQNPFFSAEQILQELNLKGRFSVTTIKNILTKNDQKSYIAEEVPFLTDIQKENRLRFVQEHIRKDPTFWIPVDFSDECRFELCNRGKVRVRWLRGQRHQEKFQKKRVNHGNKNIMVWGYIRSDGTRKVVRVTEHLNSQKYCNMLQAFYIDESVTQMLQQDGAPCHTSNQTRSWMERNNIEVLENWPSSSPDLNIIEHMWAEVKRTIKKSQISSLNDLWEKVQEAFYSIPDSFVTNLYDSIPKRLEKVVMANGGNTTY